MTVRPAKRIVSPVNAPLAQKTSNHAGKRAALSAQTMKAKNAESTVKLAPGEAWFVSVGYKGCVCFVAKQTTDGKVIPSYNADGEADRGLLAVPTGTDIVLPWSGKTAPAIAGCAAGGYVSSKRSGPKVTVAPLAKAPVQKLTLFRSGKPVTCYVPNDWRQGQSLPQYVGTTSNGALGRVEPQAHPDAARRDRPCYAALHAALSFEAPKAESAKAK